MTLSSPCFNLWMAESVHVDLLPPSPSNNETYLKVSVAIAVIYHSVVPASRKGSCVFSLRRTQAYIFEYCDYSTKIPLELGSYTKQPGSWGRRCVSTGTEGESRYVRSMTISVLLHVTPINRKLTKSYYFGGSICNKNHNPRWTPKTYIYIYTRLPAHRI